MGGGASGAVAGAGIGLWCSGAFGWQQGVVPQPHAGLQQLVVRQQLTCWQQGVVQQDVAQGSQQRALRLHRADAESARTNPTVNNTASTITPFRMMISPIKRHGDKRPLWPGRFRPWVMIRNHGSTRPVQEFS
jgi:hypothetical protein